MAELLAAECGCHGLFWFLLKLKLPLHFSPPESEGTQIVFPYVHSDENAFLPLFLSVIRTTGFFLSTIPTIFFFPQAYSLCWTDALFFSSRSELLKKKSDRQANFLKINLLVS